MTFPTFVGMGTQDSDVGGGTINPGLPTGWQPDDIHTFIAETPDFDVTTEPSGYTRLPDYPLEYTTAATTQLSGWWRRAESGDTAPSAIVDAAGNHITGVIAGIRGCPTTGDPWDVLGWGNFPAGNPQKYTTGLWTPGPYPGDPIITTVADCLVMVLDGSEDDVSGGLYSAWTNASLANVTERFDAGTTTGNGGHLFVMTGEKATPGDTGEWQTTKGLPIGGGNYYVIAFKAAGAVSTVPESGWGVLLS